MPRSIPESSPPPSENARPGAPAFARIASSQRLNVREEWYPDALERLKEINEEAVEQGYPTVGKGAKAEAARLLHAMRSIPWEPAIYPSMDGETAIYFKSPRATAALLILLDNSRRAACYWSTAAENTHKRYEDVSDLPDEFLLAKMRTMTRPDLLQTAPESFRRDLV